MTVQLGQEQCHCEVLLRLNPLMFVNFRHGFSLDSLAQTAVSVLRGCPNQRSQNVVARAGDFRRKASRGNLAASRKISKNMTAHAARLSCPAAVSAIRSTGQASVPKVAETISCTRSRCVEGPRCGATRPITLKESATSGGIQVGFCRGVHREVCTSGSYVTSADR